MKVTREFDAKLTVDEVTIDQRDVELLEAIDRFGSIHRAASELGRSYARMQRRIVELEENVGALTERRRGGRGGGGTDLTPTARELRQRFERHRTGLHGVAAVTESVLTGTVADRNGELGTVETPAGPVLAVLPAEATDVQVSVRSDAIVLTDPAETPERDGTSLRNQFRGTVTEIESGDAVARVSLELEGVGTRPHDREDDGCSALECEAVTLEALVTRASVDVLALEPGTPTVASFKATAARGTRIDVDVDEGA